MVLPRLYQQMIWRIILGKYKAANFLDVLAYCAKTTTTAIANFSAALLANLHINRSV